MKLSWLIAIVASGVMGLIASAAAAPSQWEQPAASLAEEIAGILGPGQAHLTIRNNSTIPTDGIPAIRRLLVRELKSRGVTTSETETANLLRVTLSENLRERLWVAEIVEGNETRVVMVHLDRSINDTKPVNELIQLRKQTVIGAPELMSSEPILFAAEKDSALLILHPEGISVLNRNSDGWQRQSQLSFSTQHSLSRDARGLLIPSANGFTAFIPGLECTMESTPPDNVSPGSGSLWSHHCHQGLLQRCSQLLHGRRYTKPWRRPASVLFGIRDSPPCVQRGAAHRRIDGKVQLVENGALKPVSGTRDWGSDFARSQLRLRRGHADHRLRLRRGSQRQPSRLRASRAGGRSGQRPARHGTEP
jgi:hypothetical protein